MLKRFFILIIISIVASTEPSLAQSIQARILARESRPAEGANLLLISKADSAVVKTAIADQNGHFMLNDIVHGSYILKVSVLGFKTFEKSLTVNTDINFGDIQLQIEAKELSEVKITASKPLIERHFDKLVMNVENSILAAGNSAWDVLGKAPGVQADQNDQLSLKGRSGVVVMIDGKRSPLAGADLANYLRSLSSETIQKIELISNPSARYDAQGSSGIIDIRLIKDKRSGTHATLTLAYGQGKFPKTNNGVTFNHSSKKINLFGNYSFAYRENFNNLILYRQFIENGVFAGAYDQDNFIKFNQKSQIGRLGMDYKISGKTDIGMVLNANRLRFSPRGHNKSFVINQNRIAASKFETINKSEDNWHDWGLNLNLTHKFDSTGKELRANLDYAPYGNETVQNFTTQNYTLASQPTGNPYLLHGDIGGRLKIYSAKVDYVHPIKKILNLEFGIKSSYVQADNNLKFYNRSNGENLFDSTKSNHFIYSENINAAYVNGSMQKNKWMLQAGLRLENTHVRGQQVVTGTTFTRNYTNLFPSGMAAYTFNPKNETSLSISRRLNRPSYNQLNPFKFFLDPTTFKEGNPYLKPMYSWNFELTHTLMQKYSVQLGYSHTADNIVTVLAPVEGLERITVQTEKNLNSFDYYGVSFEIPLTILKKWQSSNSLNIYYGFYRGNLANTQLSNGNVCVTLNSVNTIQFTNGFSAEISGNFRSREIYGFMDVRPTGYITAGFQKHLLDKKATIKLTINDIFYTNRSRASTIFSGYIENFHVKRDTRVAVLNLTYRFGNGSLNTPGRKQSGAEDEKRRAGSSAS